MNTPTSRSAPLPPTPSTMRVLIVDDDDFQIDLLSEMLRGLGIHDIMTASNGSEALQQLNGRATGVHLMLLDLHMPGMDGFEFMESSERLGFTGGLIIVSGQSDEVMRGASLVARLRRFKLLGTVAKPVDRAQLAGLVAQLG